jgi:hypothetical protein
MAAVVIVVVVAGCGQSEEEMQRAASDKVENDAMDACESAVLQRATNRSSVKFKHPSPHPRITKMPDGQYVVYTRFLAKNAYGAESMSMARCAIASDAATVLDLATTDSR